MRSLWSGSLGFGLVSIPVKLYNGVRNIGLNLDMLHGKDLSPIRYAKVCKEEGEEVPYEEIVKGYEFEKGQYVVLTDQDYEKADIKKSKSIEILSFADAAEIDPNYFEKPYLLEPDKGADKAYTLLREALRETGRVGIAQFVMRNKEHLCLVRPQGRLLVLNQMRFSEELQDPAPLTIPEDMPLGEKEIELAKSLVAQLTEHFEPQKYRAVYQDSLKRIIEAKIEGREPAQIGRAPEPSNVRDLMSLLEASLKETPAKAETSPEDVPAKSPRKRKKVS